MNIFTNVKTQIHLPNAAEYYGVQVNKGGFVSYLFHEERTPSMAAFSYPIRFLTINSPLFVVIT